MIHIDTFDAHALPSHPTKLPCPPTGENVNKLKDFLIKTFETTTFYQSTPFPPMNTKPVHIHLKSDAIPIAKHTPIPVPYNWKKQVNKESR